MKADPSILRTTARPTVVLVLASVAGLTMFFWPFLFRPSTGTAHNTDAPFLFVLILPVLLAIVLSELSSGRLDTKALAILGVLCALGAALRPLGAGTAGIETTLFLLVLAGRVYGPGFGFVLGALTLFTSALLTGGIGPWLPFQMLAAAWVGLGAGLLPPARGRREVALLAAYGVVASYAFGFLMNLWFWPFTLSEGSALGYTAGAPVLENLHRFLLYCLATSAWGWDTGRAITTAAAILLFGSALLATLRRATRRAAFDASITFTPDSTDADVLHGTGAV